MGTSLVQAILIAAIAFVTMAPAARAQSELQEFLKTGEPPKSEEPVETDDTIYSDELPQEKRAPRPKADRYMREGRLLGMGVQSGYRFFTGNLGQMYGAALDFGISLSYFWRINSALRLAYISGDHPVEIKAAGVPFTGTVNVTATMLHLHYYFETMKWRKGAFALNPHLIGGLSQNSRIYRISGNPGIAPDSGLSIDLGAGVEYPISRNSYAFGLQLIYQLVKFADEETEIQVRDSAGSLVRTGQKPAGDSYSINAVFTVHL